MKSIVVAASVIGIAAGSVLSGCASIVSGRHADISIDSYPTNAHVVIHDYGGRPVAALNTPGTVSLKRNRRFFLPARYTAVIDAPGYEPAQVPIRFTVNPWILGNILIGGVPGWIVDDATGAAWRPRESQIHRQLEPLGGTGQEPRYSANERTSRGSTNDPQYVADRSEQAAAALNSQQNAARSASAP